mgnify:CR=1 FL=1
MNKDTQTTILEALDRELYRHLELLMYPKKGVYEFHKKKFFEIIDAMNEINNLRFNKRTYDPIRLVPIYYSIIKKWEEKDENINRSSFTV